MNKMQFPSYPYAYFKHGPILKMYSGSNTIESQKEFENWLSFAMNLMGTTDIPKFKGVLDYLPINAIKIDESNEIKSLNLNQSLDGEYFAGQIVLFSFDWAPNGWLQCNGQTLSIHEFDRLFFVIGTRYGGDGRTVFNLPDLRGRVPVHQDAANKVGSKRGSDRKTGGVLPEHTHGSKIHATNKAADNVSPEGNILAYRNDRDYKIPGIKAKSLLEMNYSMGRTSSVGSGTAFETRSPYLGLSYCINMDGIIPVPS